MTSPKVPPMSDEPEVVKRAREVLSALSSLKVMGQPIAHLDRRLSRAINELVCAVDSPRAGLAAAPRAGVVESDPDQHDYLKTVQDDLATAIGRIDPDFPNYGSFALELPAGHWRALSATLSDGGET